MLQPTQNPYNSDCLAAISPYYRDYFTIIHPSNGDFYYLCTIKVYYSITYYG